MSKHISAEQAKINISPLGVSEHEMTGQWVAIIARSETKHCSWYYAQNDAPLYREALLKQAHRWMDSWNNKRED